MNTLMGFLITFHAADLVRYAVNVIQAHVAILRHNRKEQ